MVHLLWPVCVVCVCVYVLGGHLQPSGRTQAIMERMSSEAPVVKEECCVRHNVQTLMHDTWFCKTYVVAGSIMGVDVTNHACSKCIPCETMLATLNSVSPCAHAVQH